jgi:hypothetical protein
MIDLEYAARLLAYFVIFYGLVLLLTACQHTPKSVCVMDPQEGTCWIAKSEGLGRSVHAMEGEFCMTAQDNARVLRRLNECQNTHVPVVGRKIESLCVMDAYNEMCWISHVAGTGRPLHQMGGDLCLDRPDFEKILRRLNACQSSVSSP